MPLPKTICYTANEIFHNKMLMTSKGTPHKSTTHIIRLVDKYATGMIKTKRGLVKVLTQEQIDKHNREITAIEERIFIPIPPTNNTTTP